MVADMTDDNLLEALFVIFQEQQIVTDHSILAAQNLNNDMKRARQSIPTLHFPVYKKTAHMKLFIKVLYPL